MIGGNDFGFLAQFGRPEASGGDILLNYGKGNFAWLPQKQSGLHVAGQTRDIVEIPGRSADYFLFLVNNSYPFLYQVNKRSSLFNQLARK